MSVLYTPKQIQDVLRELRIKPVNEEVTTQEAARILTWRARNEQGVNHTYPGAAVRRHVQTGNLKANPKNKRFNMYKVEDVFAVPLVPTRGIRQQKNEEAVA